MKTLRFILKVVVFLMALYFATFLFYSLWAYRITPNISYLYNIPISLAALIAIFVLFVFLRRKRRPD